MYDRLSAGCELSIDPNPIHMDDAYIFVSDSLARHYSSTHVDPATQMVLSRPTERQRVSRACKRCSTSKIRCDGQLPCAKCSMSGNHCYYEEPKKRKSNKRSSSDQPAKRLAQDNDVNQIDNLTSDINEGQQTPAAQSQVIALAPHMALDAQARSPAVPAPDQSLSTSQSGTDGPTGSNETIPCSSTFDIFGEPNIIGYQNDFDNLGWMTGSFDPYLWPISFDLGQEFDMLQNIGSSNANTEQTTTTAAAAAAAAAATAKGLPSTPASDIADLYSRSHSPALDKDAVEVRQYHPTSIEVDAPLHFPDVDPASLADAELEDFAHVHALSSDKVEAITQLAEDIQRGPHHPPFTNLKLPPQPILNAWVQLYFEYFHPVFPILHKPTFSLPEVDPLLVLAVAGIGAQFSKLRNARTFARGIHELVRRRSSSQVSTNTFPSCSRCVTFRSARSRTN